MEHADSLIINASKIPKPMKHKKKYPNIRLILDSYTPYQIYIRLILDSYTPY